MKKSFKKVSSFMIFVMLVSLFSMPLKANEASVYKTTEVVTYSGGTATITVLWADLSDDRIRIDTVLANDGVGSTASLASIYEGSSNLDAIPLAAINGTFFNANADMQPLGNLVVDGKLVHGASTGTTFSVAEGNDVRFDPLYVKIVGGVNGQWEWPFNWYAWNINHVYEDDNAIMLFDSNFKGVMPEHDYTVVTVDKKVVTQISVGTFDIPEEGYLIITKDVSILERFSVGDKVEYMIDTYSINYEDVQKSNEPLAYENIRTALEAGPLLVNNGVIVADPVKEGFVDEKLTTKEAARSLIGITVDNKLCMAVVPGVTIAELAEIALSLGLKDAMNLDGGGSSGMIYKGDYLFTPSRELSNAIVIRHLKENPIRILLNGKYVYFDTEPYINAEFERTLVPLRGITEALGATVGWDGATSSITIKRYKTELKLKVNSTEIYVNGEKKSMEVPVVIRDGRSYVPVRFITEYLGGDVDWDNETRTVLLDVKDTERILTEASEYRNHEEYEKAIETYLEVLKLEDNNIEAIKGIASIYNSKLKDYDQAIVYYQKAIDLDEEDFGSVNSLAWVYNAKGNYQDSIDTFDLMLDILPNNPNAYYGIALCYSSYSMQDITQAKKFFKLAIDNGLSGASYDYAKKYISEK